MTSPTNPSPDELIAQARAFDRWDGHNYEQGFGTARGSPIPFELATALSAAQAEIERLREAGRMALAAIDDHNEHRLLPRSARIEEFYMKVPVGSKITCLSDARTALNGDRPMDNLIAKLEGATGLHEKLANCHPKLQRGQVWCRTCGYTETVSSAYAMKHGWPKHCGDTMTIDSPEESAALKARAQQEMNRE